MLTYAEEIILLMLDPESGRLPRISAVAQSTTLAGAVLMDLATRSKIDTDMTNLMVVDGTATGEAVLDLVLTKIVADTRELPTAHWLEEAARLGPEIERRAFARLVERMIVKVEERTSALERDARRYDVIDEAAEREVKLRLLTVLYGEKIPEPRDVGLICLCDSGDVFELILAARELKRVSPRIAQVRRLDMIGQTMANTIESVRERMTNAIKSMASENGAAESP